MVGARGGGFELDLAQGPAGIEKVDQTHSTLAVGQLGGFRDPFGIGKKA